MYLCVAVAIAGIIGYSICIKTCRRQEGIYFLILIVSGLFGLLICLSEPTADADALEIRRREPGEGRVTREYLLDVEDLLSQEPYQVVVDHRHLTGQELTELFEEAIEELEITFLGENESFDHVNQDVVLPGTVADGLIHIRWNFDRYTALDLDGKLREEGIAQEGTPVKITATLTYEKITVDHHFSIMVFPKEKTVAEQFYDALDMAIQSRNEESGGFFRLPEQVAGRTIQWTPKPENRQYMVLLFGLSALAGVAVGRKQDERKARKRRQELLAAEYPQMLSQFSLLLGAGMTVSGAWERIVQSYEHRKELNKSEKALQPVYEEMSITYHQIRDGMGERTAYEEFGKRIQLQAYRKFSTLLVQNLRKGTAGLSKLLDKEVQDAARDQESMLKKRGEELETKLLLPMMLMLGLVIVIILIPAVTSFHL